jgi:hypothetical protein
MSLNSRTFRLSCSSDVLLSEHKTGDISLLHVLYQSTCWVVEVMEFDPGWEYT